MLGDIIIGLFKLVIYVAVGYWLFDDSKSRDRNPFFWLVGLIVLCIADLFYGLHTYLFHLVIYVVLYIVFRPKGELIYCVECFKKKLESLKYCPHCFHIDEDAFEEENKEEPKDETSSSASNNEAAQQPAQ